MTISLALIAKEPASGRAKTRLAATLGARNARRLAEAMLLDSAEALATLGATVGAAGPVPRSARRGPAPSIARRSRPVRDGRCRPDGSLGHRLAQLSDRELGDGASACVIAAADSPFAIEPAILDCVPVTQDEVVLAPCADGGYWAVGLARPAPMIFDVPMSTASVVRATIESARAAGRSVRLLPDSLDLDLVSDLERAARSGVLGNAPRTAAAWAEIAPHAGDRASRWSAGPHGASRAPSPG